MAITGLTTFFTFNDQAKEAAEFYVSVFPGAQLTGVDYYPGDAQMPAGSVITASFELFGQPFVALNAGPSFEHTPAISFQVYCDTQEEVDQLWYALTADGGAESRCGWCSDRFGVSWQIIPNALGELMQSTEPGVSQKAFAAMLTMGKIEIAGLRAAVSA